MKDLLDHYLRSTGGDLYLGEKEGGGALYIKRKDLETHAHFLGPTGTGKTRALQLLAQQLIDAEDCSVVVLDPHDGPPPFGGLFHALKSYCYEKGHDRRLITVDPGTYFDHGLVTGFNPLHRGRSPIVRAGLAVEHLRAVVGHGDQGFASQPMLARWGFNTFLGLIACELAMVDARSVLNLEDATYRHGFAELLAQEFPDVASDWRWLIEREKRGYGRDIVDDKLGSTTSRLRFYTNTEALSAMLSTRARALDAGAAIRNRQIVLANLSPRGFILREDQRMLGIQLLHTFLRAAMDRTDDERVPCYMIVDEFSEFVTPEVLEILDGGRKFGIHLVLAHQHLTQLQNLAAQDWRYYHSVLGNARLRVVFGGLTATDGATIAEHMYGAHLDPYKVKQEIYHTIQTSHLEWMKIRSYTTSSGGSSGQSRSSSSGTTDMRNEATSQAIPPGIFGGLNPTAQTFCQGYGSALSASTAQGDFDSQSWGESSSEATVPVSVPDEPRLELGSREFARLEEQLYEHAAKLRLQPNQHAIVQVGTDYPVAFRVGDVPTPSRSIVELRGPDGEVLRTALWAVDLATVHEEAHERDRAFRELVGERRHALPPADRVSPEDFGRPAISSEALSTDSAPASEPLKQAGRRRASGQRAARKRRQPPASPRKE